MDSSSLNIFCPEHNSYVQFVCLSNHCYQKLLCEACLKKHREVHSNHHVSLKEMIDSLKQFQKIKLAEGEDLVHYYDQVKNGHRVFRDNNGKTSEITFAMMQYLNGKDQDLKFTLFNEKALVKKHSLLQKEVKNVTNVMQLFVQAEHKRILAFEKNIMESLQNQLKRATTRRVLDEKFLKDSSINVILDDLKDPHNRYNQLSKNLQKFHKGYLELKVSRNVFREMSISMQTRFKTFQKNLTQFFEIESQKMFSFMIDSPDIPLDSPRQVNESVIEGKIENLKIDSPILKVLDPKNPHEQMKKMIIDLKNIHQNTQASLKIVENYAPDFRIQTINAHPLHLSDNQIKRKSEFVPQEIQKQIFQNSQIIGRNNSVGNKQHSIELIKSLDYQKREMKTNFERIENNRFAEIQKKLKYSQPSSFSQLLKSHSKRLSMKNLASLYSVPKQDFSEQKTMVNQFSLSPESKIKKRTPSTNSFKTHNYVISGPDINQQNISLEKGDQEKGNMINELFLESRLVNPQFSLNSYNSLEHLQNLSLEKSIVDVQVEENLNLDLMMLCEFKGITLLNAITNPHLRTYGFLNLNNSKNPALLTNLSRPFNYHPEQQREIGYNQMIKNFINDKQSLVQNQNSYLAILPAQKQNEKSIIIGIEEATFNILLLITQRGSIQAWQILIDNSTDQFRMMKEIQLCETISCYSLMKNSDSDENDKILLICGSNEVSEPSILFIIKYEVKKNKFFQIDQIRSFHGTNGIISAIETTHDKLFRKKNNLPRSLQLVTDAIYIFSLNLFDTELNESESQSPKKQTQKIQNIPSILVQKIGFHREKHGTSERSKNAIIKLNNNSLVSRIIFDEKNDCLWGHSDYLLFKWRINFQTKQLETSDLITLCESPKDIISSFLLNEGVIMVSSLFGNIWGIDIMMKKIIYKDLERFKYSQINHYQKIKGKNPVYIISGSKIQMNTLQKFNKQQIINHQIKQNENCFIYSTLSSSGVKLFCFGQEFKEVIASISGQENHVQQLIFLQAGLIVGSEDFTNLRIWNTELL